MKNDQPASTRVDSLTLRILVFAFFSWAGVVGYAAKYLVDAVNEGILPVAATEIANIKGELRDIKSDQKELRKRISEVERNHSK